ncbi:ALG6/ALG8 family glucosyltransferase xit [Choristoneura fumiferana]|uniref:ALG6/ALG8 family glucosyltransferase xit n=1 Tax=Choristoneura fumiferana TaxID=7141 RepID=UPI003D15AABD
MIVQIVLIVTTIKCLFIPLYHSTDFEVHRNWLAVTHNLSVSQWYYDTTSEWTLDYPPFFAWLEYVLSFVAKLFDPQMLYLTNLNYASDMTIIFQRLSVIVLDFIYIASAKSCSNLISDGKLLVFILLISNPGLLMVDHIHFQYNGVLYGFLLYSMSNMIRGNFISAAIWFTVLLNLKHIYLYVAPAYFVHLLRAYCFTISTNDGVHTPWYSFSFINLFKVAIAVITIFVLSFGPFIDHIPQIISRLFPFKRGLCHAYWAPNFWALYNFADKVLQHGLPKAGIVVPKVEASMTGGLVQEFEHTVLPSIKPVVTLVLTAVTMLPALIKLWHLGADRKYRTVSFVRCMVVCATCSFMFGWHVHEKAILLILIPMSFLSVLGDVDGRLFLILSTVGHYSLFPLLYPKNLLSIKIFMLLTHCAIAFGNIPTLYEPQKPKHKKPKRSFLRLPMLGPFESLYVYGLIVLCVYENLLHTIWGLDKTLPFLPLMLTSVYCGVGVLYFWITYYYYFIYFNVSKVPMLGTGNLTQYTKKIK